MRVVLSQSSLSPHWAYPREHGRNHRAQTIASLVMTEGVVRVDDRPVDTTAGPLVLPDRAVLVTKQVAPRLP